MYSHGLLSLSILISEIRTMLSLILAVVCGILMSASSSLGVKLYGDACAGQLNMKCKVTDMFAHEEESYYPMCMKDCAAGACPENICDCECDANIDPVTMKLKLYGTVCTGHLNLKCSVTDEYKHRKSYYKSYCMVNCGHGYCPVEICQCECNAMIIDGQLTGTACYGSDSLECRGKGYWDDDEFHARACKDLCKSSSCNKDTCDCRCNM